MTSQPNDTNDRAARYGARAFGLTWLSDTPLLDFESLDPAPTTPDITVARAPGSIVDRPGAIAINRGAVCADGVRLDWFREVVFNTYGGGRVAWQPGPDWTGRLPPSFFGTLTAILLAWRGLVPVHGSAVAIDGSGYLICGSSGAGKSTLAAALISRGAKLISDDLSALRLYDTGGPPTLLPGRPAIRLHPGVGDSLVAALPNTPPPEVREPKVLLRPDRGTLPQTGIPLRGIILRQAGVEAGDQTALGNLWQKQLFRPRWMSVLPGRKARDAGMILAAGSVPLIPIAPVDVRTRHDLDRLAHHALTTLPLGM